LCAWPKPNARQNSPNQRHPIKQSTANPTSQKDDIPAFVDSLQMGTFIGKINGRMSMKQK
jgi:hypothetical protein